MSVYFLPLNSALGEREALPAKKDAIEFEEWIEV